MFIAEIHLAHPSLALTHTIESGPDVEIELEYQTITDPDTYHLFFKVSGDDYAPFEAALADDPTVSEVVVLLDASTFRVYRMRLESVDQLVLPQAGTYGLRVLQATAGESGWIGRIQVPEAERLHEFRDYCESKGITFEIRRVYQAESGDGDAGLTAGQREVLLAAHEAGYFEEPRAASLQEVADRLEISSSSASGRLRRAIDALVETTLVGTEE